ADTGKEQGLLPDGKSLLPHGRFLFAMAFSPEEDTTLTVGDTACLWSAKGEEIRRLGAPGDMIRVAAFSRDGQTIATAGRDQTVRFWASATGAPRGDALPRGARVNGLAFCVEDRLILIGRQDRTARLWDRAMGTPVGPPVPHGGAVLAVAVTLDGQTVATAGED